MYKLTKKNISKIRQTKKEANAMIEDGWELEGECDSKFNITNPYPTMTEPKRSHSKKVEVKEEKSED